MVMTVAGIAGRDRGERTPRGFSGLRRVGAVRRLLRCTSGISSVEFAIILPVLMMFLFSIIAFGTALYANANMENAAREAARRMAVAEVTGLGTPVTCTSAQALDTTTAEFRACAYLINWPNSLLVTADSPGGCPEVRVTVTVDAEDVAMGDVFGFFNGRTLTAEVIMRQEAACA